jgi:hypothetical protein
VRSSQLRADEVAPGSVVKAHEEVVLAVVSFICGQSDLRSGNSIPIRFHRHDQLIVTSLRTVDPSTNLVRHHQVFRVLFENALGLFFRAVQPCVLVYLRQDRRRSKRMGVSARDYRLSSISSTLCDRMWLGSVHHSLSKVVI